MMLASRLSCALVAASVSPEFERALDCPPQSSTASGPACTLSEPCVGLWFLLVSWESEVFEVFELVAVPGRTLVRVAVVSVVSVLGCTWHVLQSVPRGPGAHVGCLSVFGMLPLHRSSVVVPETLGLWPRHAWLKVVVWGVRRWQCHVLLAAEGFVTLCLSVPFLFLLPFSNFSISEQCLAKLLFNADGSACMNLDIFAVSSLISQYFEGRLTGPNLNPSGLPAAYHRPPYGVYHVRNEF